MLHSRTSNPQVIGYHINFWMSVLALFKKFPKLLLAHLKPTDKKQTAFEKKIRLLGNIGRLIERLPARCKSTENLQ